MISNTTNSAPLPIGLRVNVRQYERTAVRDETALGDIRKSRALTLEQVANKPGGELRLLVTFPEGGKVEIAGRRKAKG